MNMNMNMNMTMVPLARLYFIRLTASHKLALAHAFQCPHKPLHKQFHSDVVSAQEPDSDTAVPAKPKRSKAKKPASPDPSETQLKPPTPHSGSEGPASGSAAQQQQGEGPTSLAEAVVAPEFQLEAGVVAEEAARPLVGSLGDGCQEPLLLHHTSPGTILL